MALYCYVCDECQTRVSFWEPWDGWHPERIYCASAACKGKARRDYRAEQGGVDHTNYEPCKQRGSMGMSIPVEQLAEAQQFNKEYGVGNVDYDTTSVPGYALPRFSGRAQRARFGRAWGAGDLDAGYGDTSPTQAHETRPDVQPDLPGPKLRWRSGGLSPVNYDGSPFNYSDLRVPDNVRLGRHKD